MVTNIRKYMGMIVLAIIPIIFITISLMIGAYHISPSDVMGAFGGKLLGMPTDVSPMAENLIFQIRLPRILGCILVGAGLSITGVVFQGIFKNPLASPYTLGVSNGAGFGAAIGILMSFNPVLVQITAIIFGLISMVMTFILSSKSPKGSSILVLAGMLVGSLFASFVSLIKFVADPFEKLPQIVFWLMGSMASVNYTELVIIAPICIISILFLCLMGYRLNVISMGDQVARSFGINVKRDKIIVIILSSIITATVVSISGIIGWVGIVIPHMARQLVGPDFKKLLPTSLSLGISYLIIVDTICRSISSAEIPLGVVTGIAGAPLFMYFILTRKVDW